MRIPPCDEGVSTAVIDKMKAHELLSSPDTWCQEALAKDGRGDSVPPFDPGAVSKSDNACAAWNGTIRGNRPIRKFERFCLRRTFDGPCDRGGPFSLNLQKTDFNKCQIEKN
jgi:hypothetical protein